MTGRNLFHRLGDAVAALMARLRFARDALTGAFPLPTPLERSIIMSIMSRLAALEAFQAAQADINATVSTAADAAHQASSDVAALGDRVSTIEAEIGTDAPAQPAPAPVDATAGA